MVELHRRLFLRLLAQVGPVDAPHFLRGVDDLTVNDANMVDGVVAGVDAFDTGRCCIVEHAPRIVREAPDQLHAFRQHGRLAGPLDAHAQPLRRHLAGADKHHRVGATLHSGFVLGGLGGAADARSVVDLDVRHGFGLPVRGATPCRPTDVELIAQDGASRQAPSHTFFILFIE